MKAYSKESLWHYFCAVLCSIALYMLLGATGLRAETPDADTLAREINTDLRKAQGLMFSGKKDDAIDKLLEAQGKIRQLEEAAPEHSNLANLQKKAEKQARDLENRTGKQIDLSTMTVTETSEEPAKPPVEDAGIDKLKDTGAKLTQKPVASVQEATPPATTTSAAPEKLPYHARSTLDRARRLLQSLDSFYGRLDYYIEKRDFAKAVEELEKKEETFGEIAQIIAEARELAAKDGVTEHPDFDEKENQLKEQKDKWQAELAKMKGMAENASAQAGEVQQDADALIEVYNTARDKYFDKITGTVIYYNDLEPVKELLQLIETLESEDMANLQAHLEAFTAKYGDTEEAISAKMDEAGYSGNYIPDVAVENLRKGLANVAKTRTAMAEDLAARAVEMIERLPAMHDFIRVEQHNLIREYRDIAKAFDASAEAVKTLSANLESMLEADKNAFLEEIDDRKWKESVDGMKREQKAGMEFFENSPDWGKRDKGDDSRHPVALSITGQWSVQNTDVLGQPIQYGVPAWICVAVDSEKDMDVYRVYNVTLRTQQQANARQEPPFVEITVGDSWYIRPEAVK